MRTHFEQNSQLSSQALEDLDLADDAEGESAAYLPRGNSDDYDRGDSGGGRSAAHEHTGHILDHGRSSAYHPGRGRRRVIAATAVVLAALVTFAVLKLSAGGGVWPASVARVQAEVARACQNPDVQSEPGQVNFACARSTRQILWVLALLTSGNNPGFADAQTGRVGLEPITPSQGGEVAWSLNLHHPYDPTRPIDSIQVAARAINNIVGGATLTGSNGQPVVQPGLEGVPANCQRYTGSAALITRNGFPSLCAEPVSSRAGRAALVADIYQKWIVGASGQAAQDAAVLFDNAANPGDPRVQAILRDLASARLTA